RLHRAGLRRGGARRAAPTPRRRLMPALAPERIESLYRAACLAELDALKVGNVHAYAGGHRMETADFVASAEVSAPFLAAAGA
ncbi:triphosphoribosyl-dephospho-CoA synthase, partial [Serratia marcescens]|uniref:triphosphoribosyl-dephospho-CoA synthase n=1 Tax=Serratia marcescens TaxID=615 RepID=UPI0019547AF0